ELIKNAGRFRDSCSPTDTLVFCWSVYGGNSRSAYIKLRSLGYLMLHWVYFCYHPWLYWSWNCKNDRRRTRRLELKLPLIKKALQYMVLVEKIHWHLFLA